MYVNEILGDSTYVRMLVGWSRECVKKYRKQTITNGEMSAIDHGGAGDDAALPLFASAAFLFFINSDEPWNKYFRSSRRRFKTSCFDSFSANVISDSSVLRFCSSKIFSSIDS
jgi:hypothetical protein